MRTLKFDIHEVCHYWYTGQAGYGKNSFRFYGFYGAAKAFQVISVLRIKKKASFNGGRGSGSRDGLKLTVTSGLK